MPYLIENGVDGVLVPEKNPSAMVDAIVDLLEHPEKAHRIALAANRKVQAFDWEVVKEEWIGVLDS